MAQFDANLSDWIKGAINRMRIPGEDNESVTVNVWVNRRVMSAAKVAAILKSQTPSQLMEDILMKYLKSSGYLDDRHLDN